VIFVIVVIVVVVVPPQQKFNIPVILSWRLQSSLHWAEWLFPECG
jgi:hypothetical protein